MIPLLAKDKASTLALQIGNQALSYLELQEQIQESAAQLRKLPEAILVLEANLDFSSIIQILAALTNGQPIALFAPQWTSEEKESRLKILGNWMAISPQHELLSLHEDPLIKHHPQLAMVLFTSGSTGQIKAVQLSEKNISANCQAVIKALDFATINSQLLFLPLSYSFGLLGQLIPGLMSGIQTTLINQFTDIIALMANGEIPEMWSGVPSHWVAINRMAQTQVTSAAKVKAIVSAGAPLAIGLRKELQQNFPNATIYNNYGLTEASPRVLTYSSKDPLFMEDYAGYPVGDWQVKVSKQQELLIKGSQLMLGYLGDEQNQKITNDWLATGDIATILPTGLVAIQGRRDNIVNVAGEKVNLIDVEQTLCHQLNIKELVVVATSDAVYGMRLIAFCEQISLEIQTTAQSLTDRIRALLLPKKMPISAQIIDQFPRTQNGKLDRNRLVKT